MQDERGPYEVVFTSIGGLQTNIGPATEEKPYGKLKIRAASKQDNDEKKKKKPKYVHRKSGPRCIDYVHMAGHPECVTSGKKKKSPQRPKKTPKKK